MCRKPAENACSSAHRHGGHARHRPPNPNKEEQPARPFPVEREVREDQGLPPWIPVKGREPRKGGESGRKGGRRGRRGNRANGEDGSGPRNDCSEDGLRPDGEYGQGIDDDDVDSRVKVMGPKLFRSR